MFAAVCEDRPEGKNEIGPYWVYLPPPGGVPPACIERYVPALPLSRDRARADALRRSVALYRVAFGQPRQDDLLAYLAGQIDPAELDKLAGDLQIDLSPPPVST